MLEQRERVIGVIGGSGLYDIPGLTNTRWQRIQTPFGEPSDALLFGELAGQSIVFLPRHGRGHQIPPSELNYRANIAALKMAGATEVLSVSAVGSLSPDLPPGSLVVVDQFIDRTVGRARSFFGKGLVAHVSMAQPVCARLGSVIATAAERMAISLTRGGTYIVIEGPQFSTAAESQLYRQWGGDVIGMTNLPEARLAREAELCYATVATVTDYDCWHPEHDDVTVDAVVKALQTNADNARQLVKGVVEVLANETVACSAGCQHALDSAIITAPEHRDPQCVEQLRAVAGRVL